MRVVLLEPEPRDFASAVAYVLARYSRSSAPLGKLWEELSGEPEKAAERLARIFHGYGHDSVAGMAHTAVALEDISLLDSLRFFYVNPYGDGQERSTRYQTEFEPYEEEDLPQAYGRAYRELVSALLDMYRQSVPRYIERLRHVFPPQDPTQEKTLQLRALDCARYLLPLGVRTSLGQVQSARAWRDYLKYLSALPEQHSQKLQQVLARRLAESGIRLLVRHCTPPTVTPLKIRTQWRSEKRPLVADVPTPEVALVEQVLALTEVAAHPVWLHREVEVVRQVGAYLTQFDHHNYCRWGNTGAIRLRGYADLGTVKDLNRHRSLEKFMPFLEPGYNLAADLQRSQPYERPPYEVIAEDFDLDTHYQCVRQFYRDYAGEAPSPADHQFYTKLLLPQAHRVAYTVYGSPADLVYVIRLRHRPGGHQRYRQEVSAWARALAERSTLWEPLAALCGTAVEDQQSFYSRG